VLSLNPEAAGTTQPSYAAANVELKCYFQ
jgi:hypothetical protein